MNMYERPLPPDDFRQTDPRLETHDPPEPPGLTWPEGFGVLIKVRDTLSWIMARFWSPAAFGALTSIMRSKQRELLTWIRPLEAILRRLFLIEAHALAASLPVPTPRTAPAGPPQASASPGTRPIQAPTADPATWSAPFSTHVSAAAPSASAGANALVVKAWSTRRRRPKEEEAVAARPIAVRIEALIRAVIDPMPCIRRLARQIRRQGAPAFADRVASEPCQPPSLRRTLARVTDAAAPLFSSCPHPPHDSS